MKQLLKYVAAAIVLILPTLLTGLWAAHAMTACPEALQWIGGGALVLTAMVCGGAIANAVVD